LTIQAQQVMTWQPEGQTMPYIAYKEKSKNKPSSVEEAFVKQIDETAKLLKSNDEK